MNVIFTCGGTAGHINPAIAVANVLRERDPEGQILFIGAEDSMEGRLVPQAGFELRGLPASSFSRSLSPKGIGHNIQGVFKILSALAQAKKIIREFKPDVIVGTGGYASFPALYMGSRLGIPTCVHEANAQPGLATRLVADRVEKILVAFDEGGKAYAQQEKVEVVGMPVRREFIYTRRSDARRELGLGEEHLVVSAFGSQGAREMNKAVADMLKLEYEAGVPFRHIHATGSFGWKWMPELVKEKGVNLEQAPGLDMREYIYNMPTVLAAADLFIGRAGASTCNECAAAGIPTILIPSPNVTDNHQEKNARVLERMGGCVVMLESECSGHALYEEVNRLLADEPGRKKMRQALLGSAKPDSAERICDILMKLAQKR